ITLSKKRTANRTVFSNSLKLILYLSPSLRRNLERLIEPRLQTSKSNNGCSPQGLVVLIVLMEGIGFARHLLVLSINQRPGSPVSHAIFTMVLKTILALSRDTTSPFCAAIKS